MLCTSRRRILLLTLAVIPTLAIAACGSDSGPGAAGDTKESAPIRLGVITDQTGYLANTDKPALAGAELAVKTINAAGGVLGRQLELVVEDFASDPNKAVSATQKMVSQEKVTAIVGASSSAAVPAEEPILARAQIPSISTGVVPETSKWQVSLLPQAKQNMGLELDYLVKNGLSKIGVLRDPTPYNDKQIAVLEPEVKAKGLQIVGIETHAATAVDLRSQVDKLLSAGADAVVKLSYGPTTLVALQALAATKGKTPLLTANETGPGARSYGKIYPETYIALIAPQVYDFLSAEQRGEGLTKFMELAGEGTADRGSMARGWDQVQLLAAAMRKANSTDGAAIRKALTDLGKVDGVAAPVYDFTAGPTGVAVNPFYLVNPKADGKLEIIAAPAAE